MKKALGNRKGATIIFAAFFMIIAALAAAATTRMVRHDYNISSENVEISQAKYAAEAGIEDAGEKIINGTYLFYQDVGTQHGELGDGLTYSYDFGWDEWEGSRILSVVSTGKNADDSAVKTATMRVQLPEPPEGWDFDPFSFGDWDRDFENEFVEAAALFEEPDPAGPTYDSDGELPVSSEPGVDYEVNGPVFLDYTNTTHPGDPDSLSITKTILSGLVYTDEDLSFDNANTYLSGTPEELGNKVFTEGNLDVTNSFTTGIDLEMLALGDVTFSNSYTLKDDFLVYAKGSISLDNTTAEATDELEANHFVLYSQEGTITVGNQTTIPNSIMYARDGISFTNNTTVGGEIAAGTIDDNGTPEDTSDDTIWPADITFGSPTTIAADTRIQATGDIIFHNDVTFEGRVTLACMGRIIIEGNATVNGHARIYSEYTGTGYGIDLQAKSTFNDICETYSFTDQRFDNPVYKEQSDIFSEADLKIETPLGVHTGDIRFMSEYDTVFDANHHFSNIVGFFANDSIYFAYGTGGSMDIDNTDSWANTTLDSWWGSGSVMDGKVSGRNIYCEDDVTFYNDLSASGNILFEGDAHVTGAIGARGDVEFNTSLSSGADLIINDIFAYGDIVFHPVIDSIVSPDGTANIKAKDNIVFGNDPGSLTVPHGIDIYSKNDLTVGNNINLAGDVYTQGDISAGTGTTFTGQVNYDTGSIVPGGITKGPEDPVPDSHWTFTVDVPPEDMPEIPTVDGPPDFWRTLMDMGELDDLDVLSYKIE